LQIMPQGDFPALTTFLGKAQAPLAAVMAEATAFQAGDGADAGSGIDSVGDDRPIP
jgi:hypothetical protein